MQDIMNISQNKDNSQIYLNEFSIKQQQQQQQQNSKQYPINKDQSFRKKGRRKSQTFKDFYYNDEQQKENNNNNNTNNNITNQYSFRSVDKSYIQQQYQGIETALQLREQMPTHQNSIMLFQQNSSEINHNDTSSNEIDLFQKSNSKISHNKELPPLRIQIRPSMKQDSSEQKSTHVPSSTSPGLKRWRKLSLVMKSIQAFQKSEIKSVKPSDIEEEIKNSPSPKKKINHDDNSKHFNYEQDYEMIQILDNYRRVEELCQLCQSGSLLDIERIKDVLQSDPKKYIRSPEDPEHLLNKLNSQGQFPLYIACMNQNIEVVKLLLKCGALPNTKTKQNETCLEVSARWRYVNIVEILLSYSDKFDIIDLQKSKDSCQKHPQILQMLNPIINKRSNNIFKLCFPCFF